jgi:hypothetical protein
MSSFKRAMPLVDGPPEFLGALAVAAKEKGQSREGLAVAW